MAWRNISHLAEAFRARELLRNSHGVAVQFLAEVSAERGAVFEGQEACLEIADEALCIDLLFLRPLASSHVFSRGTSSALGSSTHVAVV